jgi:NADPH:quinone reductase-like Zn-dependent oxidoreductase
MLRAILNFLRRTALTEAATMRAWRIHRYGGPEELVLEDAPVPVAREGEILLRVAAASVNPIDWRMRSGEVQRNFPVELPRVLGRDCAGVVVESRSSAFKPGDRVLGINDQKRTGTHAEYAVVAASQATLLPPGVTEIEAVAIGNSGSTAWPAIAEIGRVSPGMRVLIHAAAGGVGGIATQLARHFGGEVFGTCSTANVDHVQSLGARAIDYTCEDFVEVAAGCDLVFDMVGGETHRRSYQVLKPGGCLAWIPAWGGPACEPLRQDVRVEHAQPRGPAGERLGKMMALVSSGALRPQVGRTYAMEDARAAYAASQSGRSRGKNVIVVRRADS